MCLLLDLCSAGINVRPVKNIEFNRTKKNVESLTEISLNSSHDCRTYLIKLGDPTPFFPKTHRNLDLGMGKNGEKSIWKERETNFLFSK